MNNIKLSTFNDTSFVPYAHSSIIEAKEKQVHLALVGAGITPEYIAKKLKELLEDDDERIVLYALRLYVEMEGLYKRFNQPIIPIQVNIEAVKESLGLNKMTDEEIIKLANERGIRTPDSFERN